MTGCWVVDASFAFRLILPGPMQSSFLELVAQWKNDERELYAPTLWLYEMTSARCKVVRLGDLAPDEGRQALVQVVLELPKEVFSALPARRKRSWPKCGWRRR